MIRTKEKKERSLGERFGLKGYRCSSPKCAIVRKPYPPGEHGKRRSMRRISEYGRELREKQKFKVNYKINDRTLRHLFERSRRFRGCQAVKLLELLERRLDNIVFRLGFAPSRAMARQLIFHGHITVGGKRVRSPGYEVSAGSTVGFWENSKGHLLIKELRETLKKYTPPDWLSIDMEKLEGKVLTIPKQFDSPFEINLLVESLSK